MSVKNDQTRAREVHEKSMRKICNLLQFFYEHSWVDYGSGHSYAFRGFVFDVANASLLQGAAREQIPLVSEPRVVT